MVSIRSQQRRTTSLWRVIRSGIPLIMAAAVLGLIFAPLLDDFELVPGSTTGIISGSATSNSSKGDDGNRVDHRISTEPPPKEQDKATIRNPHSKKNPELDANASKSAPTTIAYAWTLTKCGDFQSSAEGMIDSALVLRHSVHLNSVRTPLSESKYDYKMYVLVHPRAASCTSVLEDAGYHVKVLEPPVDPSTIQGDLLRTTVHREWCCGSDEFIKLYAYTLLEHPVVVHLDIDFMFVKPMDDLIDSMILPRGKERDAARASIITQYPNTTFPDKIEAYLTRDYQQVYPGQTPLFQAGFMVVQPDMKVFEDIKAVIRKGDFREGSGWGGKGYNNLVGAKAMQGLIAYYYDQIRPNVSVELHGCRYNYMGGANTYRGVPNYAPRRHPEWVGKCRADGTMNCENCEQTKVELIHSIHYTNCRKPWNCIGVVLEKGQDKKSQGVDERNSNFTQCMKLVRKWHEYRTDLEEKVLALTKGDEARTLQARMRNGTFKPETFMGHCQSNGQYGYIQMSDSKSAKLFSRIYDHSEL